MTTSTTYLDLPRLTAALKDRGWELAEATLHRHSIEWEPRGNEAVCCVPWRDDTKPSLHILMEPKGAKSAGTWVDSSRKDGGSAIDLYARLEKIDVVRGGRVWIDLLCDCANLIHLDLADFQQAPHGEPASHDKGSLTTPPTSTSDHLPYIDTAHIAGIWRPNQRDGEPPRMYGILRVEDEFRRCKGRLTKDAAHLLSQYGVDVSAHNHDVGSLDYPSRLREFDDERNVPGIVYLARDEANRPIGAKWRSIARAPKDRKRAPRGIWGERTALLGAHTIPDISRPAIVITGGEEKALLAHQLGYAAVSPLFGEGPSADIIARYVDLIVEKWGDRSIVLACDKDRAGVLANLRWRNALIAAGASEFAVQRVAWPQRAPLKYDINDAWVTGGSDLVRSLLDNPVPMETNEIDAVKILDVDPLAMIDEIPRDLDVAEIGAECKNILTHLAQRDDKIEREQVLKSLARLPGAPGVRTLRETLREIEGDQRDSTIALASLHIDHNIEVADDPAGWWITEADYNGAILKATSDGIFLISDKGHKRVSDFVARIHTVTSRENRNDLIRLECRRAGRSHYAEIESDQWLNSLKLRDALAAAMRAPYLTERGGLDAVREICEKLSRNSPPQLVTQHAPGLIRDRETDALHYVTPRIVIRPNGVGERPSDIDVEPWDSHLSAATGQATLCDTIEFWWTHYSRIFPTALDAAIQGSAAIIGPILPELLNQTSPRIITAIVGHTGKGKTTAARITQRLWGRTASFPQHATWRAAFQSLVEHRASLGIVDDLRSARDLTEMVSLLFDAGKREALQRTGQLRDTRQFLGAALITAESIDGAGESTANRIALIPWWSPATPPHLIADAERAASVLTNDSAHDLSVITTAVIQRALSIADTIPTRLALIRKEAASIQSSSRALDICSRLALCCEIVGDVLDASGAAILDWPSTDDVLRVLLTRQTDAEHEATPAAQFVDALEQAVASSTGLRAVPAAWASRTTLIELHGANLAAYMEPSQPRSAMQVPVWTTHDDPINDFGRGPCYVFSPREVLRALRIDTPATVIADSLRGAGAMIDTDPNNRGSDRIRIKPTPDAPGRQARVWIIRRDDSDVD